MIYRIPVVAQTKREAAIEFRRNVLSEYERWYRGEIAELFGEPPPSANARVVAGSSKESSILTWAKLHQEPKYLRVLGLDRSAFAGMTILDIGAGGIPSALVFEGADVLCLDPLVSALRELGYPFHLYGRRAKFIEGRGESIPLAAASVDAVISVNALDHVDDFEETAQEVRRVLRPGGSLHLHMHYHAPTVLEPLALDDERVGGSFGWCQGMAKTRQWNEPDDHPGEHHVLWSNGGPRVQLQFGP